MKNKTITAVKTIEAVKATTSKPAAKKAAKTEARKSSTFKLTAKKFDAEKFGTGQRAAIAKILNKLGVATRQVLAAKLPDVPLTNISWHLSMMVKDKDAKRLAA